MTRPAKPAPILDLMITPGMESVGSDGCPCCGGLDGRIFGFAYRSGNPVGLYQAGESGLRGSGETVIAVTIGPFGRETGKEDRDTVAFLVGAGNKLTLTGKGIPSWPEMAGQAVRVPLGKARTHPRLAEFRAVAEAALDTDFRLREGHLGGAGGFQADVPVGAAK